MISITWPNETLAQDEIHTPLDSYGQTFRYPESSKGDIHLPNVQYINIPALAEVIEEVAATFRTWMGELEEDADWYRRKRRGT